ncbi:MAG: sensor histidine kinase [Gemmatimonadaceae bacterium]
MSKLWTAFVLGWLSVPVVTGFLLRNAPVTRPRLAAALLGIVVLSVLYVWTAMRWAIAPSDLTPEGPPTSTLRTRLLLMGAMTLTIVLIHIAVPFAEGWWLAMYVIIAAGLALPPRLASGIIASLIAASLLASILANRFDAMLLIHVAFAAAAVAMRQLTISVAQLKSAREELARTAVDQERLRFSRDLHDILGHTLSAIILKSELAGRLLPGSPTQAAVELGDIERSAREAQRQVRSAVVGYRQPDLHRELEGARELLAAAGVEPHVTHSVQQLPLPLQGLLAWAVREGVTNVVRHSRARHCEIDLSQHDGSIRLLVRDDGRAGSEMPNVGSGLAGLAERAATHGAVLESGPRPEGGFQLVLTASLSEEAR